MKHRQRYQPMPTSTDVTRREFVKLGAATAAAGGIVLGVPSVPGAQERTPPPAPETNINDFMKVPKGKHALPGAFPGRVVEVKDPRSLVDDTIDAKVVAEMFERGRAHPDGQGHEGELRPLLRAGRRHRRQGQPGGPAAHQHPRRAHPGGGGVAPRQQGARRPHRHLGPVRLHAEGRRLHARPVPEGRPDRRPADDGRDGEHLERRQRKPRQPRQVRQGRLLLREGHRRQGRPGLQGRRVLPEPARVQRRVLVLREAPDEAVDEDRQSRGLQEHGRRHLDGDEEHGVRLAVQHGPAARAAVLQRLHRGARGAGRPRETGAERHRGDPGPVRRRPRQERAVRLSEPRDPARHRPVRARHDLPPPARGEAQGDGHRGEREPAVHRLPALRGAAGAGGRESGEDSRT